MTKDEALDFLRQHQPMPPDREFTDEVIRNYEEVRRFFLKHPYSECIPLFLNSFGEGMVQVSINWSKTSSEIFPSSRFCHT